MEGIKQPEAKEEGWREETAAHSQSPTQFIFNYFKDQVESDKPKRYNSNELHFSGGKSDYMEALKQNPDEALKLLRTVEVFYEDGQPSKLRGGFGDSSILDVYLSGTTLEDYSKTIEE